MAYRMKPLSKALLILLVIGALFAVFQYTGLREKLVPAGKGKSIAKGRLSDEVKKLQKDGTPLVKIGVVTWGGYIGGQYWNKGFSANTESNFYKDDKILVDFVVLDDFESSRNAFKSGDIDLLWVTADAFSSETKALEEYEPVFLFQADWSRGGDVIIGTQEIKTLNDLKGKSIAVALGTPSHTFLLMCLESAGIDRKSIKIIEQKSAVDAAATFKAGAVDAAVVWSPDDEDCLQNVIGSHIIKSTKTAGNIIADGFFAKKSYIVDNKETISKLIEGWMKGSNEINNNPTAKQDAIKILAEGLNLSEEVSEKAINNVRLANLADNKNFFNLNSSYKGVTGELLYNKMGKIYKEVGLISDTPLPWRNVSVSSFISSLDDNSVAEKQIFEKETADDISKKGASTKQITVVYNSGSFELSEDAKYTIDKEFGDMARMFNSKIRIEGNTDTDGNYASNKKLSKMRAKSVANYLIEKYNMDPNKFVIIGNGSDKPVADNDSDSGKQQNRRTDFIILD